MNIIDQKHKHNNVEKTRF